MRKAYPGHAKRVMMGVWSFLRQFMYTKLVIVVDDDIDARDWKDVMWAISTRMDPARDITADREHADRLSRLRLARIAGSAARSASTPPTNGRRETKREWGRQIRMTDDVIAEVTRKWAELRPARQRQADLEIMPDEECSSELPRANFASALWRKRK